MIEHHFRHKDMATRGPTTQPSAAGVKQDAFGLAAIKPVSCKALLGGNDQAARVLK